MAALLLVGAANLAASTLACADQFDLSTSSLSSWDALTFPFNPRQTTYKVVPGDKAIEVESDNANSALVYRQVFSTSITPVLRWSWKAMNVLPTGNAETKEGDDYAIRIYVMFPFDSSSLSVLDRMRFEAARSLLGFDPPADVLNYVWANRTHAHNPIPNAYSDRGMMFFADAGSEHLGEWRSHEVNILHDFRQAFGREPPARFTVAIMGDTDNTHGRTVAFIRDISVSSE